MSRLLCEFLNNKIFFPAFILGHPIFLQVPKHDSVSHRTFNTPYRQTLDLSWNDTNTFNFAINIANVRRRDCTLRLSNNIIIYFLAADKANITRGRILAADVPNGGNYISYEERFFRTSTAHASSPWITNVGTWTGIKRLSALCSANNISVSSWHLLCWCWCKKKLCVYVSRN